MSRIVVITVVVVIVALILWFFVIKPTIDSRVRTIATQEVKTWTLGRIFPNWPRNASPTPDGKSGGKKKHKKRQRSN